MITNAFQRRRLLAACALAAAATALGALGLSLAAPSPAHGALRWNYMKNAHTKGCLTADSSLWFIEGMAPAKMRPCRALRAQRWFRVEKPGTGFELRPIGPPIGPNRRCLDVEKSGGPGNTNGYVVGTRLCDGTQSQRWLAIPDQRVHSYRNEGYSHKAVAMVLGTPRAGGRVGLYRHVNYRVSNTNPRWWFDSPES